VRTAGVSVGDHVGVVGLGLVGLLTVQLLKVAGCTVYGLDLIAERAALARELGADIAVSAADEFEAALEEGTAARGADSVILSASTSSSEPIRLAGEIARDRGTVCVVGDVGLAVPRDLYYGKELTLRLSRSYGPGRYDEAYEVLGQSYPVGFVPWDQRRNMEAFLALVAKGPVRLTPLVSARFPIGQAPSAYRQIARPDAGTTPPIAIILSYPVAEPSVRPSGVAVRPSDRTGRGIAVIGAGHFAQATLLPRIANAASWRRIIVVTTSGPSAHSAAKRFDFERAGTDVEEALTDPDVGAVFIVTRHDSHAALAARALRAGLPVFVEKPLAISVDGLREVLSAVRESGNDRIMVGYNRRFSSFVRALATHLTGGAQAVSYRVNAGPLPAGHWTRVPEEGGGRLIGEGCHFVDLTSFLVGSRIVRVHADALPSSDGGSTDTFQVNLHYETGSVGHLLYVASGDPKQPKELLEAFGRGRSGVLENFQRLELWSQGKAAVHKSWVTVDKGFDAEVQVFLDSCLDASLPMPISLEDLVNTTVATFAAERSLVERRVVEVTELLSETG